MNLRTWISLVMILAFVVTTIPSASFAVILHDNAKVTVKTEKKSASSHEGCHGHGDKKQNPKKTIDDDADEEDTPGKPCCDGKNCKCVGNACHATAKVFGLNSFGFISPRAAKAAFSSEEEIAISNFYSRIKRPPRT